MPIARAAKTYTLSVDVIEALEARGKATGEKLSRLVEQGLRMVLALPMPEGEADDPGGLAPTRTEVALRDTLRDAGPGWHSGVELARAVGVSFHVGEKALKALARRGEAHRWGDAPPLSSGEAGGGCWGIVAPLVVIDRLLTRWKAQGGADESMFAMLRVVRKLAEGIGDVAGVRALVSRAVGLGEEHLGIENFAERREREAARVRTEAAKLEAARLAEMEGHIARQRAEREAANRGA